jgi:hypothetical protein
MQGLSNPHKQRICAAFASVLRFGPAKEQINPDKFFLEMSRDIELLLRDGILDLNPLFVAHGGRTPSPSVCAAFMVFEELGVDLGIKLRMPEVLTHIPLNVRTQYRKDFMETYRPREVVPPDNNIEWLKFPQTPVPIAKHNQHLQLDKRHPRAFSVSEATRVAIADAAAWALKDTAAGKGLNGAQITFLIRAHFDRFCDGHHLDLNPLLTLLRKQSGIDKRDLREGLQRLKHYLGEIGLSLDDPLLGLNASNRRIVLSTIDAKPDLHELFPPPSDARRGTQSTRSHRKPQRSTSQAVQEAVDEETLKELSEYSLDGKNPSKKVPLFSWLIPLALLLAGIIYVTRPHKMLEVGAYDSLLPLKSAQMASGIFYGVLDDARWDKLSNAKRKASAEALADYLKSEGRLRDALIARQNGRIALFHLQGYKLRVSREALVIEPAP